MMLLPLCCHPVASVEPSSRATGAWLARQSQKRHQDRHAHFATIQSADDLLDGPAPAGVETLPGDGPQCIGSGVTGVVLPEVLVHPIVQIEDVEQVLLSRDVGEGAGRRDEPLDLKVVRLEEQAHHRLHVVRVAAPMRGAGASASRNDVQRRNVRRDDHAWRRRVPAPGPGKLVGRPRPGGGGAGLRGGARRRHGDDKERGNEPQETSPDECSSGTIAACEPVPSRALT
jgi:hypothetical protein